MIYTHFKDDKRPMSELHEETDGGSTRLSAEILNILNKKFFGSLIESAGVVYGTGELGTIPDIFPMLLYTIRGYLSALDPKKRFPEIEPGMGVTLEKLGHNLYGISPSAFVLFNSRLRHGSCMVGSFSPVKSLNWNSARSLVHWIAEEIDDILDDIETTVDPITWRDIKYDVITEIINERAQLINYALNSQTMQTFKLQNRVAFKPIHMLLAPLEMQYTKIPLHPLIIENDEQFWANDNGQVSEFVNIIKVVLNASLEPLRQLNKNSLSSDDRKLLQTYNNKANEVEQLVSIKNIDIWINNSGFDNPKNKEILDLSRRYFGMVASPIVIGYFCQEIEKLFQNSQIVEEFKQYAIRWLTRRYCLGLATKKPIPNEILDCKLEIFREYHLKLSSLDREAFNSAIIRFDQDINIHLSNILDLQLEIKAQDLNKYIEYWIEEFSGIVPEEITLLLNIGIMYILCDYQNNKIFAMYLIEETSEELDIAGVRETAHKAIEANKLPILRTTPRT